MEAFRVLGSLASPFTVGLIPGIVEVRRAPVQGRADNVITERILFSVVATGLGDVDLSALGPLSIDGVLRHHPDGRPHPVSLGHFGHDLDTAVFDGLVAGSCEAGRSHGVDDQSTGCVADGRAGLTANPFVDGLLGDTLLTEGAGSIFGQIYGVAGKKSEPLPEMKRKSCTHPLVNCP